MISTISNIYDLLEQVEKRKAMYLGNGYTFLSLNSFITGYTIGCNENQLETVNYNNFSDFSVWILGHLPEHFGEAGGWHWQITNRNLNNDSNAFKEFFEFLEIFKNAKKEIEKIETKKIEFKTVEYDSKLSNSIPKKKKIDSIHKITMESSQTIWIKGFYKDKLTYETWCISEKEYKGKVRELREN